MRKPGPLAISSCALALGVLGLAVPVQALLRLLTFPFDRHARVSGRFLHAIGGFLVRLYPRWRLKIVGELPPGPFVLVANHRSWLDVLVLARLPREMKWMTKEELFRLPWIGNLLRLSGDIPVRRGDATSADTALERAREVLAAGLPVVFFAEGTRSRDGALRSFKLGAFLVAVDAGVPVIPVVLTGTAEGMPPGGLALHPARIVASILEPVAPGMDPARLRDEVRARIAAALDRPAATPAPATDAAAGGKASLDPPAA